jgi:type IV fimbrial biogenesis protein FimT
LIELMVAVTIAALVMAVAVPNVGTWMADAKVRTAAEALQNAVRLAQATAIQRSRQTGLALTDANPAVDATPAANGKRWFVRVLPRSNGFTESNLYVRGGGEVASGNITISGPALLCFNAFGQLTSLASTATGLSTACDAPTNATTLKEYAVSSTAGSRTLKIRINIGGQARLCDASKTLSDSNPDGC